MINSPATTLGNVQVIPQKLLALEELLEQHPEWVNKLVMFLVIRERSKTDRVRCHAASDTALTQTSWTDAGASSGSNGWPNQRKVWFRFLQSNSVLQARQVLAPSPGLACRWPLTLGC